MSLKLHSPPDIKESSILSYATQVGDLVFTSGLVPRNPTTGEIVQGGIEEQTVATFENLNRVLNAVGASASEVAKVNVVDNCATALLRHLL